MEDRSTFQKLREDERETRRKLIVETAMSLFRSRQVSEIGMRDIAKKASISAAAIYRYFPSRDDILVKAIIKHIHAVEERLEKRFQTGQSSLEELAIASADYLMEHESLIRLHRRRGDDLPQLPRTRQGGDPALRTPTHPPGGGRIQAAHDHGQRRGSRQHERNLGPFPWG
jgi:AcrR family transcriptional regulator